MRSTSQIAAPHRHIGNRLPFGALAYAGAGISIVFCFAKTIILYVFLVSGIGIAEFAFNPHLQAILMWLFALMGVIGLSLDKPRCGSSIPTVMGLVSFIIIVGTLYGRYHTPVLMMGYTLLLSAAFLNQSLRLRQLNLQVAEQAESLQSLNATLEQRVTSQVQEIESLGRLKRFLAPAVAELLVNEGENRHLDNHRRHIATLFCDIRGFTSFTESMEPEEVMGVLAAYHEQMGRLASMIWWPWMKRVGCLEVPWRMDCAMRPELVSRTIELGLSFPTLCAPESPPLTRYLAKDSTSRLKATRRRRNDSIQR